MLFKNIYCWSVNFCKQNPVITIQIYTIRNFAWGQMISMWRICKRFQVGHKYSLWCLVLKWLLCEALLYFKWIEEQAGVTTFQTKSDQNEVCLEFLLGVWNSLVKQTFWKTSLWLVNTFEITLVRGEVCVLWGSAFFDVEIFYIYFSVQSIEVRHQVKI